MLAFIGTPGVQELAIIGLILFLLFGAKKIPNLMRGIGKGVREYKGIIKEVHNKVNDIKNVVK